LCCSLALVFFWLLHTGPVQRPSFFPPRGLTGRWRRFQPLPADEGSVVRSKSPLPWTGLPFSWNPGWEHWVFFSLYFFLFFCLPPTTLLLVWFSVFPRARFFKAIPNYEWDYLGSASFCFAVCMAPLCALLISSRGLEAHSIFRPPFLFSILRSSTQAYSNERWHARLPKRCVIRGTLPPKDRD